MKVSRFSVGRTWLHVIHFQSGVKIKITAFYLFTFKLLNIYTSHLSFEICPVSSSLTTSENNASWICNNLFIWFATWIFVWLNVSITPTYRLSTYGLRAEPIWELAFNSWPGASASVLHSLLGKSTFMSKPGITNLIPGKAKHVTIYHTENSTTLLPQCCSVAKWQNSIKYYLQREPSACHHTGGWNCLPASENGKRWQSFIQEIQRERKDESQQNQQKVNQKLII